MNQEEQFKQLEKAMSPYQEMLCKAADTVLDQDVSNYPIFVLHQQGVDMGIAILDRSDKKQEWSVNISTLEEFATKKIIQMNKVGDFRSVYKDPTEFLCLFVLDGPEATFIFLPRKF